MYRGVIVAISVVMITLMVFSIHSAYAISYDIKDQLSCQSLSSGSPSWDSATNTCKVTSISLTLGSGDSLSIENGTTFVINSGIINANLDGGIQNYGVLNNYGAINANDYGDFRNLVAGTINNHGSIFIRGSFINNGNPPEANATTNNFGVITNSGFLGNFDGIINNYAGGQIINNNHGSPLPDAGHLQNDGIINNYGLIWNRQDSLLESFSILNNYCGGVIQNEGTITGFPFNQIPCVPEKLFCGKPSSAYAHVINGTSGNDNLVGTNENDLIIGNGGNDTISGLGGDDCLLGGPGNDIIYGGAGNDYIDGGSGDDKLYGGTGNDTILGANGNDYINGGDGDDKLYGGTGNDEIHGMDGNDYINAGDGEDKIYGGAGNDEIHGMDGNDYINGGDGTDSCFGGIGINTVNNCESK